MPETEWAQSSGFRRFQDVEATRFPLCFRDDLLERSFRAQHTQRLTEHTLVVQSIYAAVILLLGITEAAVGFLPASSAAKAGIVLCRLSSIVLGLSAAYLLRLTHTHARVRTWGSAAAFALMHVQGLMHTVAGIIGFAADPDATVYAPYSWWMVAFTEVHLVCLIFLLCPRAHVALSIAFTQFVIDFSSCGIRPATPLDMGNVFIGLVTVVTCVCVGYVREMTERQHFVIGVNLTADNARQEALLNQMLPRHVRDQLKHRDEQTRNSARSFTFRASNATPRALGSFAGKRALFTSMRTIVAQPTAPAAHASTEPASLSTAREQVLMMPARLPRRPSHHAESFTTADESASVHMSSHNRLLPHWEDASASGQRRPSLRAAGSRGNGGPGEATTEHIRGEHPAGPLAERAASRMHHLPGSTMFGDDQCTTRFPSEGSETSAVALDAGDMELVAGDIGSHLDSISQYVSSANRGGPVSRTHGDVGGAPPPISIMKRGTSGSGFNASGSPPTTPAHDSFRLAGHVARVNTFLRRASRHAMAASDDGAPSARAGMLPRSRSTYDAELAEHVPHMRESREASVSGVAAAALGGGGGQTSMAHRFGPHSLARRSSARILFKETDDFESSDTSSSENEEVSRGQGAVYPSVSVMFVYVNNLSTVSAHANARTVVKTLNAMYSQFDDAIAALKVFKVMAIANMYLVISGAFEEHGTDHAASVAEAAITLLRLVRQNAAQFTLDGEALTFKIGIHSGEVAGGVIGTNTAFWHIFGHTVNVASRICSTSDVGRIHISTDTANLLRSSPRAAEFTLRERGTVFIRGVGNMHTWWLSNPRMDAEDRAAAARRRAPSHGAATPTLSPRARLAARIRARWGLSNPWKVSFLNVRPGSSAPQQPGAPLSASVSPASAPGSARRVTTKFEHAPRARSASVVVVSGAALQSHGRALAQHDRLVSAVASFRQDHPREQPAAAALTAASSLRKALSLRSVSIAPRGRSATVSLDSTPAARSPGTPSSARRVLPFSPFASPNRPAQSNAGTKQPSGRAVRPARRPRSLSLETAELTVGVARSTPSARVVRDAQERWRAAGSSTTASPLRHGREQPATPIPTPSPAFGNQGVRLLRSVSDPELGSPFSGLNDSFATSSTPSVYSPPSPLHLDGRPGRAHSLLSADESMKPATDPAAAEHAAISVPHEEEVTDSAAPAPSPTKAMLITVDTGIRQAVRVAAQQQLRKFPMVFLRPRREEMYMAQTWPEAHAAASWYLCVVVLFAAATAAMSVRLGAPMATATLTVVGAIRLAVLGASICCTAIFICLRATGMAAARRVHMFGLPLLHEWPLVILCLIFVALTSVELYVLPSLRPAFTGAVSCYLVHASLLGLRPVVLAWLQVLCVAIYMGVLGGNGSVPAAEFAARVLPTVLTCAISFAAAFQRDLRDRRHYLLARTAHRQSKKCAKLLLGMLPSEYHVERLMAGEQVVQELEDVTLLYSDLKGFTALAAHLSAAEVIKLLDRLYAAFDAHLQYFGLYKVDTIGDAFIVVGGMDNSKEGARASAIDDGDEVDGASGEDLPAARSYAAALRAATVGTLRIAGQDRDTAANQPSATQPSSRAPTAQSMPRGGDGFVPRDRVQNWLKQHKTSQTLTTGVPVLHTPTMRRMPARAPSVRVVPISLPSVSELPGTRQATEADPGVSSAADTGAVSVSDARLITASTHTSASALTARRSLSHAGAVALFAMDMLQEVERLRNETGHDVQMRIGLHTGRVVGGIIGRSRPRFFIWGADTVIGNLMESMGEPGQIHVSATTAAKLQHEGFVLERHAVIPLDNPGSPSPGSPGPTSPVPPLRLRSRSTSHGAMPASIETYLLRSFDAGDVRVEVPRSSDHPNGRGINVYTAGPVGTPRRSSVDDSAGRPPVGRRSSYDTTGAGSSSPAMLVRRASRDTAASASAGMLVRRMSRDTTGGGSTPIAQGRRTSMRNTCPSDDSPVLTGAREESSTAASMPAENPLPQPVLCSADAADAGIPVVPVAVPLASS